MTAVLRSCGAGAGVLNLPSLAACMLLIYFHAQGQPSRDELEKQLNLEHQKRIEAEKMRVEVELRIQAVQVGVVERITL